MVHNCSICVFNDVRVQWQIHATGHGRCWRQANAPTTVPASYRKLIRTPLLTRLQVLWPSSAVVPDDPESIRLDLDHANSQRSGTAWWVDY